MAAFIVTNGSVLVRQRSFESCPRTSKRSQRAVATPVTMFTEPGSIETVTTLLTENSAAIQKLGEVVRSFGTPEPILKWGHPVAMGLMLAGMGVPGAAIGWYIRLGKDKDRVKSFRPLHKQIMTAFWLLAFAGATGGISSKAAQGKDVFSSPHFYSSVTVMLLLSANAFIALSGFGSSSSDKKQGRSIHAYLGATTMGVFALHAYLGATAAL